MSIARLASLAWICSLLLTGCAGDQVKVDTEKPFAEPAFEFRGIDFVNNGFSGMDVVLKFELVSKDSRATKVVACPYTFEMEGMDPASGTATPAGELKGNSKVPIANKLSVPWPKGADEIQEFLKRKQISYKFSQTCNVTGPGGPLTLSAGDAGSVPLPKLPELTVSGANAERFGRKDIRLNFELSMVNENNFNVDIDKIVYKVMVEGKPMAEGEIAVAESIPPSNEASYDIATQILSGSASREIHELVKKPAIEYHLEGKVVSGDFEIPVDATGTITFPH